MQHEVKKSRLNSKFDLVFFDNVEGLNLRPLYQLYLFKFFRLLTHNLVTFIVLELMGSQQEDV